MGGGYVVAAAYFLPRQWDHIVSRRRMFRQQSRARDVVYGMFGDIYLE